MTAAVSPQGREAVARWLAEHDNYVAVNDATLAVYRDKADALLDVLAQSSAAPRTRVRDTRALLTVWLTVGVDAGEEANTRQLDEILAAVNAVAYVEGVEVVSAVTQ